MSVSESSLDLVMACLYQQGVGEIVALKGGYLLHKLLNSRATTDIDFSYGGLQLWPNLREAFVVCGDDLTQHGIVGRYVIHEPQEQPKRSAGIVFYDLDDNIIGSVDASVQNLGFGLYDATIPMLGGIVDKITLPVYTFERILGDKISANFSKQQFRRTKDLFDIYQIITTQEIVLSKLQEALKEVHQERILEEDCKTLEYSPFAQSALPNWEHAWNKLDLNRGSRELISLPPLCQVLAAYSKFLAQAQGVTTTFQDYLWNPKELRWEEACQGKI